MKFRKKILFLCTGNSCRSQMAEGWTRFLKNDQFEAYSAGIKAQGLNPRAVAVMKEVGINLKAHTSKTVDDLKDVEFDVVCTVCDHARETCPVFPNASCQLHFSFDDPPHLTRDMQDEEEILKCYRRVRDEIREFVQILPGLIEMRNAAQ